MARDRRAARKTPPDQSAQPDHRWLHPSKGNAFLGPSYRWFSRKTVQSLFAHLSVEVSDALVLELELAMAELENINALWKLTTTSKRDALRDIAKHGRKFSKLLDRASKDPSLSAALLSTVNGQSKISPNPVTQTMQSLVADLSTAINLIICRAEDLENRIKQGRGGRAGKPRDIPMVTFVWRVGAIAKNVGIHPAVDFRSPDGKYACFLRALFDAMPENLRPASANALIEQSNNAWGHALGSAKAKSRTRGKKGSKI